VHGKRTELYVRDAEPEKKVSFALKKAGILRPVVTKGNDTVLMDNYRIYLENNIKNLCFSKPRVISWNPVLTSFTKEAA